MPIFAELCPASKNTFDSMKTRANSGGYFSCTAELSESRYIYLFITIIDAIFKLASFKFDSFNVLVLLESEEFVLILATV